MKRSLIVGVMGGGVAEENTRLQAWRLGELIAEQGWILLNGGRNTGIMEASAQGAAQRGGIVVGILPGADDHTLSTGVTIPIFTGMGNGRNVINVLSSDVIVACPGGAGTLSEMALALKTETPLICLGWDLPECFLNLATAVKWHSVMNEQAVVDTIQKWFLAE